MSGLNNNFRTIQLGVGEGDLAALAAGQMAPERQANLSTYLRQQDTLLRSLPLVTGVLSPRPPVDGDMEGVTSIASASVAAATLSASSSTNKGSLLEVLSCTRAMKTHAKNLLAKLTRLRVRLVNLKDATSLEKQKKYFQFRLVTVENIDQQKKAALDKAVGDKVMETLVADVVQLIKDLETEQTKFGEKLQNELDQLAFATIISFPENPEE